METFSGGTSLVLAAKMVEHGGESAGGISPWSAFVLLSVVALLLLASFVCLMVTLMPLTAYYVMPKGPRPTFGVSNVHGALGPYIFTRVDCHGCVYVLQFAFHALCLHFLQTHTHACTHARAHTRVREHTYTHTHVRTNTHAHERVREHTHTRHNR